MTRWLLASWVALAVLSCSTLLDTAPRATTRGIDVTEFTKQVQFPGVESNLMSTTVYRATVNGAFPEGMQKFELWVDSVSIPARLIQDRYGIGMDMGGGKREGVRFSANRHRYRQGTSGAMVIPEESYDLSGIRIETGGAWLVFSDRWGNTTHWDLGVPRTLPKQYAP